MNTFYISLGSNIEPEVNVPRCIRTLIDAYPDALISPIYETEPVGPAGGSLFWNAALEIKTVSEPHDFVKGMKTIEAQLGRVRDPSNKYAARTIDIDLAGIEGDEHLPFIIIPLADIAPNEVHLSTGKTYAELAEAFKTERLNYRKIIF